MTRRSGNSSLKSVIIQCRITEQQRDEFIRACATQKRGWYGVKTSSEILREFMTDFTKKNLPSKVEE